MQEVFQSPDPTRDGRTITVAETLDRALTQLEATLNEAPERRVRFESTLGKTYHSLGLFAQAVLLREKVYNYWTQLRGPEDTNTLAASSALADS